MTQSNVTPIKPAAVPKKSKGKKTAAEQTELLPEDLEEGKPTTGQAMRKLKLAKVKPELMHEWLGKWHIAVSADAKPAELAELVLDYQLKMGAEDDLADCDNCHGISLTELPSCPFCGDGAEEEGKKPEAPQAKPEVPRSIEPAKPTALGKPAAELDEHVARINDLKTAAVVCYWDLGREIYAVWHGRLYTQRTHEDGSATYKSFAQWCDVEIGFQERHARRLMEVALAFSRDDVARFGVKKLLIATQLPEEERQRLIEKMAEDDSLSSSAIAKEVKDQLLKNKLDGKGGRAPTVAEQEGRAGKTAASREVIAKKRAEVRAAAKKQGDEGRVTVASLLGRVTIPLFCGVHGKGMDKSKVRAQRIGDEPVGTEDLVNDVVIRYRVGLTAKGLVLVVDRSRGTGAEEPAAHTQTKADNEKPVAVKKPSKVKPEPKKQPKPKPTKKTKKPVKK
jgi:hypothetical protein